MNAILHPVGLSKRLVVPLVAAVLCSLGLASWTLGEITHRLDDDARARSVALVAASWRQTVHSLEQRLVDYAEWGAAYEHLHKRSDTDWAYAQDNFGVTLFSNFELDRIYVLGPSGAVKYAVVNGEKIDGDGGFAAIGQRLERLIAEARTAGFNETKPVSAALDLDGRLAIFGAAALSTASDKGVEPIPGPQSLVIFGRTLSNAAMRQIEQDTFVTGLHLASVVPASNGTATFPIETADDPRLSLRWTAERPGGRLLRDLAPVLAVAGGALALLLLLTTRSALRTADSIERNAKAFEVAFEDAHHRALHDQTTGLPNRAALALFLQERVSSEEERHALLYIDVDHFKSINDTFGHPTGDVVLRRVAETLVRSVRSNDIVARIGGDEFIVVVRWRWIDEVEALCARLLKSMAIPIEHEGERVEVGLSIGVACAPRDAQTGDDLLKMADVALYRAKAAGRRTFRFFADAGQASEDAASVQAPASLNLSRQAVG